MRNNKLLCFTPLHLRIVCEAAIHHWMMLSFLFYSFPLNCCGAGRPETFSSPFFYCRNWVLGRNGRQTSKIRPVDLPQVGAKTAEPEGKALTSQARCKDHLASLINGKFWSDWQPGALQALKHTMPRPGKHVFLPWSRRCSALVGVIWDLCDVLCITEQTFILDA